jgi:hypothetical protein
VSIAGRQAAATVAATARPTAATSAGGRLLVATVVRVDSDGVWAHVAGETHDRGPLPGDIPDGATPGLEVLLAFPDNSNDPWIVGHK